MNRGPGAEAAVAVEGVTHRYGDVTALADVSLRVPDGSVTAVVGPNGSGKSTLLGVVAGVVAPTEGRVRTGAEGTDRAVGYLPQEPRFRPEFTVEETLTFYATLLSSPVDVEAAAARVGLADVRDRRVDALSGGDRRLLGLAQATLGSPPVVVLDEPASGLDYRMTARVRDVVAGLATDGTAVLLTTHDLDRAASADRLAVVDRGRVVARGPPTDVAEESGAAGLSAALIARTGDTPAVQSGAGGAR